MKLKAPSTIRLALAPEIKHSFLEENNPKDLCEKLERIYMSKSLTNKLFLKKDFFEIEMEEDSDLNDHLNNSNGLIYQLASSYEAFRGEDKALCCLHPYRRSTTP